jgi:hypothetical protein
MLPPRFREALDGWAPPPRLRSTCLQGSYPRPPRRACTFSQVLPESVGMLADLPALMDAPAALASVAAAGAAAVYALTQKSQVRVDDL